jgi:peptide/nickel transport system ATP-binding protein
MLVGMPEPLLRVDELLRVNDLRIAFGAQEAVRGVSFAIAQGETLGLVGESGSGKSATSLALMRLLPGSAKVRGSIKFAHPTHDDETVMNGAPGHPAKDTGVSPLRETMEPSRSGRDDKSIGKGERDLLALPEERMRRLRGREMAMVFQEPMTALNPVMTVGRQIGEALLAHAPRTPRSVVRERVVRAMREVGLPEPERRMKDYPHQFSGGQRQRVVIAMAIINKPRLLIADEPTTALDVTVQAQVLELLKELKRAHGLSMLFISHDLAVVAQVADRVAVMRQGEIVEMGDVQQVMTRPQHAYTKSLLASAPTMKTDRELPLAQGLGVRV